MWYSGHDEGMHGSMTNVSPRRRRPRMLSMPARYIQPADPVYQLHPPRPACGRVQSHDVLDRFNDRLWLLTSHVLRQHAEFSPRDHSFTLITNPFPGEPIHVERTELFTVTWM